MGTSNLVKWGSYDEGEAAKEATELEKMKEGSFAKLKVGKNVFRILPPRMGQKSPFVKVHQHFLELPGMTEKVAFNCPRRMANQPCPSCKRADQLRATGDERDYKTAGGYVPNLRVFCAVIDRSDPEGGPKILAVSKGVYEELNRIRQDTDDGGNFSDPINGFDVVINRKGTTKRDTEYTVKTRPTSRLGTDEEINTWITAMPDLQRQARVESMDDILEKLREAGADLADIGEDDEPVRRPKEKAKKGRTIDTDGRDVTDEDDD